LSLLSICLKKKVKIFEIQATKSELKISAFMDF
jgi:hypothetical protein